MGCNVATTQLAMLRLLSSRATQNLTYNCINSPAHFDEKHKSCRNKIDIIFSTGGKATETEYEVLRDGCKDKVSCNMM